MDRHEREQTPSIAIRKFNNFIKSVMLSDALACLSSTKQLTVLDLCCGRGGDLPKYGHCRNISKVVMVDQSAASVAEAQKRYTEHRPPYHFQAEFHVADAFDESAMSVILDRYGGQFDVVNCQFALHYAFESIRRMKSAISVIDATLHPNTGVFVATIPDAEAVIESAQSGAGSPHYVVKFEEEAVPTGQGVGQRYFFSLLDAIDNVPEYVVWQPLLDPCMASWAHMTCESWRPFLEVFADAVQCDDRLQLAKRMGAVNKDDHRVDEAAWTVAQLYCGLVYRRNEK